MIHRLSLIAALLTTSGSFAAAPADPVPALQRPTSTVPATGLANSAALRATILGPAPGDMAPMPERVPLQEINIAIPGARPVPPLLWFDRRLRVWFAPQPLPAPLAIVIGGTGAAGNSRSLAVLRGALYGAGYHVLTLPSPTFPGFIASASTTGVGGDLRQDSQDLYAAITALVAHLRKSVTITDIDVLGYSLGGAHAAVVKSLDATAGRLHIRRAVLINPPVSLFASMTRLDRLFASSIGSGDDAFERLYRRLYAQLANSYRAAGETQLDDSLLPGAIALGLTRNAELSAVIALTFRLEMGDMFFLGDLSARTGVVTDPAHVPGPGDSLETIQQRVRNLTFADYFSKVFTPYYLRHRPGSTAQSLLTDNELTIVGTQLHGDGDYYVQTNSDDLILDQPELQWLRDTLGPRIAVYDHGGHLGNLGERRQIADMLDMLAGRWQQQP